MGQALLEPFDLRGRLILADKGYDSDKFVRWVEERGGIVVIPSRVNAKHPRHTDWHTYKERHLVENLFLKLKNNRRFKGHAREICAIGRPFDEPIGSARDMPQGGLCIPPAQPVVMIAHADLTLTFKPL